MVLTRRKAPTGGVKKKPSQPKRLAKGPGPPKALTRVPRQVIKTAVKKKKPAATMLKSPHHHMFNPAVVPFTPTVAHEGHALPAPGRVRFSIAFNAAEIALGMKRMVLVSNVGSSATVAVVLSWDNAGNLVTPVIHSIPTLALTASTGGAVSGRAMRYSVTLTNTTATVNNGSTITYVNLDSRIALPNSPFSMTGPQWNVVYDKLTDNRNAVVVNGNVFSSPKTLVGHVVDQTTYHDYVSWKGAYTTISQFFDHLAEWPGLESHSRGRPMTTIAAMFDTPSQPQTYFCCVDSHYYTRWPIDTLQGQSHTPVPTAPQHVINADSAKAASLANVLHSSGPVTSSDVLTQMMIRDMTQR